MAKKVKDSAAPAKKRAPAAARREARPEATATNGDPNRLLREAAWSCMFGRTELKNPFTR